MGPRVAQSTSPTASIVVAPSLGPQPIDKNMSRQYSVSMSAEPERLPAGSGFKWEGSVGSDPTDLKIRLPGAPEVRPYEKNVTLVDVLTLLLLQTGNDRTGS